MPFDDLCVWCHSVCFSKGSLADLDLSSCRHRVLDFCFSVVFPWIRSVRFLRQQERISQRKFDERKDMDKPEDQREWLLCFFKPGILIFNRNAIDSLIGFTTSKVSMTHDGSTRIHLEYIDRNQKKQVIDFRHSKENQAKFEAWFYKR